MIKRKDQSESQRTDVKRETVVEEAEGMLTVSVVEGNMSAAQDGLLKKQRKKNSNKQVIAPG